MRQELGGGGGVDKNAGPASVENSLEMAASGERTRCETTCSTTSEFGRKIKALVLALALAEHFESWKETGIVAGK